MANIVINQAFLDYLAKFPEALAYFYKIIKAFVEEQSGEVVLPPSTESGPKQYDYDTKPVFTTPPLSNAEVDALAAGYAEAIVKEKAIEYIKGFITGFMLGAGA
jgi:hypothetical protein